MKELSKTISIKLSPADCAAVDASKGKGISFDTPPPASHTVVLTISGHPEPWANGEYRKGGAGYLSDGQRKLAVLLLRRAADEFANHGCNDCDVAEILAKDEANTVVNDIDEWQRAKGDLRDDDARPGPEQTNTTDWLAMLWIASLIEARKP